MAVDEDLNYAFALIRQCMWVTGIWPDPQVPSTSPKLQLNLRFIFVVCVMGLYVSVPEIMNTIRAWGNIVLVVEHLTAMNFSLLLLCKLIVTGYNGETLRDMMASIIDDWMTTKSTWKRDAMLELTKRGRILTLRCFMSTAIGIIFYMIFNLPRFYRTWPSQSQRRLIYPLAYNFLKSPIYEITFFIQLFSGICMISINASIDCFIAQVLLHMCAQLINLRVMLKNLIDELANKSISSAEYKKSLSAIAMRHKHLIRISTKVNECYSAVLFLYMLATTFQLCFQTFQLYTKITNRGTKLPIVRMFFLIFYAVIVLTHLYTYCYSAERLMAESAAITDGVYESKWYDIPPKDARSLMLIIHRSRIPFKLTAGKFATFSMELFGTTLKTSMGYVSALLAIKG